MGEYLQVFTTTAAREGALKGGVNAPEPEVP